jgi:hypothetical protein
VGLEKFKPVFIQDCGSGQTAKEKLKEGRGEKGSGKMDQHYWQQMLSCCKFQCTLTVSFNKNCST